LTRSLSELGLFLKFAPDLFKLSDLALQHGVLDFVDCSRFGIVRVLVRSHLKHQFFQVPVLLPDDGDLLHQFSVFLFGLLKHQGPLI
jgi:hypothetical protein